MRGVIYSISVSQVHLSLFSLAAARQQIMLCTAPDVSLTGCALFWLVCGNRMCITGPWSLSHACENSVSPGHVSKMCDKWELWELFFFLLVCLSVEGAVCSTLNKKSLNGQGKSTVTVLWRKFILQSRNLHDCTATVFSWVNQEICISSFQPGKYCGSKFTGKFSCEVNQIFDCHIVSRRNILRDIGSHGN